MIPMLLESSNLTLSNHANNQGASFLVLLLNQSYKDMLIILVFHLNQEGNAKQKTKTNLKKYLAVGIGLK